MLWVARHEGRWYECVVRFVPNGVEVGILRDALPMMSRVFTTGVDALAWADEERKLRSADNTIE